jgi:hypothetical protein
VSDRSGAVEIDPSVCYRHPGRQSWVLCQRCGRTVCPECQIQAPVGVHCPECVAETSGGVSWRPNNVAPLKPKRRRRTQERARTLLAPAGVDLNAPTVMLGAAIVLFLAGSFSPLPAALLAAVSSGSALSPIPLPELQLWRYLTAPFISSFGGIGFNSIVFFALSAVFFWLTAPQLNRMLGTRLFLIVAGVGAFVGNAAMVLAVGVGSGLSTILFASFAALLVVVWDDRQVRTQILVMIAINLLISVALGGSGLPALVGGMIGGAGSLWLIRNGPAKGWKDRTPALIIAAVCAALVVLAVLRSGIV